MTNINYKKLIIFIRKKYIYDIYYQENIYNINNIAITRIFFYQELLLLRLI